MILKNITLEDFNEYLPVAIQNYADESIKNGTEPDKALEMSKATFDQFLTDGFETKGQFFNHIYDKDEKVGFIWYGLRGEKMAFIYDFEIYKNHRRKGYGKQALLSLEDKLREMGIEEIGLHVFGHNHGARKLYESLNYLPTNMQMKKQL